MDSLTLISGTKENDILPGTDGKDIIRGKKGDDQIDGGAGNDFLFGDQGDDFIFGGLGNDLLSGGKGNDRLEGGDGNDLLLGGKGDDLLDSGAGNDIVLAGKGDDTANYTLSENVDAHDVYDGGKGFDTLRLTLTTAEAELAQEEIDAFKAFLEDGGKVFHFESFGLTVRNFETLEIVTIGGNTAPVAGDDTITGSFSARIKVAVVGHDAVGFDGSSYVAAAGQLDPALFNATAIAHTAAADWAAILAGYDVVVIGDDGIGADYTGSGIFSALRDFVDAGGGVVTTGWFALRLSEYTADPVTADADYITPVASGTPSSAPSGATIDVDPSHPITSGISNYTVAAAAHDLAVDADPTATVLATYTPAGGVPLQAIAVDEVGAGRTAFLGNLYMANDLFSTAPLRTGIADQIFERAVTWAAGEQQTAATDEDHVLEILRSTLLANDSDADGDALTIALLSGAATSNLGAALSINSAGNIEYDPRTALNHLEEGVIVEDSFVYEVNDGNGGTDTAIVSLKVLGLAEPTAAEVIPLASFEESLYSGLDQPLASVTADADTLL